MFISKNTPLTSWISEGDNKIEKEVSGNLKFYFYDFVNEQNIKINVDGVIKEYQLNENKIIDFELDSSLVKTIYVTDNDDEYDFTTIFKEIDRNLIYLGN
jgi:hypothetical protein